MNTLERLTHCLEQVHHALAQEGLWHCIAFGTVLGAVRGESLIPWEYDFDLIIARDDLPAILALGDRLGPRFRLQRQQRPVAHLAINPGGVEGSFETGIVQVYFDDQRVGDLYHFCLFQDGVLRRYDPETQVYWCPRSSIPAFFVEELEEVAIGESYYPCPQYPEKYLEGIYGADWRTPYRATLHGGAPRHGFTKYGDRAEPKLRDELVWCKERGWDQTQYPHAPAWPAPIRGAGPVGPSDRTRDNSRSLWWRDLNELVTFY